MNIPGLLRESILQLQSAVWGSQEWFPHHADTIIGISNSSRRRCYHYVRKQHANPIYACRPPPNKTRILSLSMVTAASRSAWVHPAPYGEMPMPRALDGPSPPISSHPFHPHH